MEITDKFDTLNILKKQLFDIKGDENINVQTFECDDKNYLVLIFKEKINVECIKVDKPTHEMVKTQILNFSQEVEEL